MPCPIAFISVDHQLMIIKGQSGIENTNGPYVGANLPLINTTNLFFFLFSSKSRIQYAQ